MRRRRSSLVLRVSSHCELVNRSIVADSIFHNTREGDKNHRIGDTLSHVGVGTLRSEMIDCRPTSHQLCTVPAGKSFGVSTASCQTFAELVHDVHGFRPKAGPSPESVCPLQQKLAILNSPEPSQSHLSSSHSTSTSILWKYVPTRSIDRTRRVNSSEVHHAKSQ